MRKLIAFLAVLALLASITTTTALAKKPASGSPNEQPPRGDSFTSPLQTKQAELRQTALEKVTKGQAKANGKSKIVKLAPGQYVELAQEGQDSIFTVLGEFSDLAHNGIAQPDRSVDNTTIWEPDFSPAYYRDLLFNKTGGANSMANYYLQQSSGRYTVDGDVTDWVQVPETGAFYGSNDKSDSYAWLFVEDSVNAWYDARMADGWTSQDFEDYLSQFDVWDRYDYDGDGNFNEPDGYIDHFQSIHTGEGEEAGGGVLGDDAIWSHRWYAFYNGIDVWGPSPDYLLGGIQIGDTNFWIGDYTIEPENGGVGVFSHEFAHDLGLPDEYDTSGNSGGAENSTGFWTLMSSGSWGSTGNTADGIGDQPFHMNAWDKWYLGWLNYDVAFPGDAPRTVTLGPGELNTNNAQGLIVVLPDRQHEVNVGSAYAGDYFYYSGAANDLSTEMTKSFDVPAGATLTAKVRYSIESGYDYAYVTVDGTKVTTNLSNSPVVAEGIEGRSNGWKDLSVSLPTGTHTIGFGYWTDGGVQGDGGNDAPGFAIDEIAITGSATDGAESDTGWTFDSNSAAGFHRTTGNELFEVFNAYVAESRQYVGYDANLKTGPYNFGGSVAANWAERFPYEAGLLVWYYDSFYSDNAVGDHPGEGLILPVDAHYAIDHYSDGQVMRGRLQARDATFGVKPSSKVTIYKGGVPTVLKSKAAVPTFDDMQSYYVASDPGDAISHHQAAWMSVNNPHTGTRIQVLNNSTWNLQISVTAPQ